METMNHATKEILTEAFKDCPYTALINLNELLNERYGAGVSRRAPTTKHPYREYRAAVDYVKIYENKNDHSASKDTITLQDAIGDDIMGSLVHCAKEVDKRAAEVHETNNDAAITGYYEKDIDALVNRFKDLVHEHQDAKMLMFYSEHSPSLTSTSKMVERVVYSAFDAITMNPMVVDFHIQTVEDIDTEIIAVWLYNSTNMTQIYTSAVRALTKLINNYCIDEYFTHNLRNLDFFVHRINEERNCDKEQKFHTINVQDIIDFIGIPADLASRIPIFIKSANKATRYNYDVDNEAGFAIEFKSRAIYNSIIYAICVSKGYTESINDMITNGIVSFRHIMRVIKSSVANMKIIGSISDMLIVNDMIHICSETIDAKELIDNE